VAYGPLGHSKTDLLAHPEVASIGEETGRSPAQVGCQQKKHACPSRCPPHAAALQYPCLPTSLHDRTCTSMHLLQVLLRWNVQRGVAVLPKASSQSHVVDNIRGLLEWSLTYEQKVSVHPCASA
jgi:diketogulonate reductase-like aldo/keto reductase